MRNFSTPNEDWLGSLNKTYSDVDLESAEFYKNEGTTGNIGGVSPVVRAMSSYGLIDYNDEQFLFGSIFALRQFALRNMLINDEEAREQYRELFKNAESTSQIADFHIQSDKPVKFLDDPDIAQNFDSILIKVEHFNEIFGRFKERTERGRLHTLVSTAERKSRQMSEEIFTSNLKLVHSIAKKHQRSHLVDFDDYMQEGTLGLLTAIEKFNYTQGNKFSTYAYYWIEQQAGALYHRASTSVGLPTYLNSRKTKLYNILEHAQKNNIVITEDYLFEELVKLEKDSEKLSKKELASIRKSIPLILDVLSPTMSLDTKIVSVDKTTGLTKVRMFAETLEDENQDVFEAIATKTMSKKMQEIMETVLKERELQIVRMHFGIGLHSDYPLKHIAESLNITRARTWQILSKAMAKLRAQSADFLEFELPEKLEE